MNEIILPITLEVTVRIKTNQEETLPSFASLEAPKGDLLKRALSLKSEPKNYNRKPLKTKAKPKIEMDEKMTFVAEHPEMTARELAGALGVTVYHAHYLRRKLKPTSKRSNKHHRYTDEELQLIRDNPGNLTIREIAQRIRVPITSVRSMAYRIRKGVTVEV